MCMIRTHVKRKLRVTMSSQHKRPLCWVRRQNGEKLPPPRVPSSGSVKDGRLSQILSKLNDPVIKPQDTWKPVDDYENYLRVLKLNGHDEETIEKIRARHIKYYEENPPQEPEPLPDYSIPFKPSIDDETAMCMTMRDDNTISIRIIENPFRNFYDKSNTSDDYIEMYTRAGCSDALIERIRRKFEEKERVQEEASRHFERVMARYSGKSSTKPKKTSLRSRFARSMKSVAIKVEDLEDDMGADDE